MLHEVEDRTSDDLASALTRTIRRWFGDPRRAGIERVTEQEIETICQLASAYVSRLSRAGWLTEGRRAGWYALRMYAVAIVVLSGGLGVACAAHYALDLNGDGQLTAADAHALVDVLLYGRTAHIPIKIKARDGRRVVVEYSYTPDAEREIEDLP